MREFIGFLSTQKHLVTPLNSTFDLSVWMGTSKCHMNNKRSSHLALPLELNNHAHHLFTLT